MKQKSLQTIASSGHARRTVILSFVRFRWRRWRFWNIIKIWACICFSTFIIEAISIKRKILHKIAKIEIGFLVDAFSILMCFATL